MSILKPNVIDQWLDKGVNGVNYIIKLQLIFTHVVTLTDLHFLPYWQRRESEVCGPGCRDAEENNLLEH